MKLHDLFKRKNAVASLDNLKISLLRRTQFGIKVFLLKKKAKDNLDDVIANKGALYNGERVLG